MADVLYPEVTQSGVAKNRRLIDLGGDVLIPEVIARTLAGQPLTVASVAVDLSTHWTDGTLLGTTGSVQSAYIDLLQQDLLRVIRRSTAGTYAFEVDWSRDGVTTDVTETVAVPNNGSTEKRVMARWARFRVRNTDAVAAFTAHRTTVSGR